MPYLDRVLICRDCGASFTFTAGEQAFFASRGFTHQPTRCPNCRTSRKLGRSSPSEGYVHYGPFASFGGRTPRQMHPAVCAGCGQMTEVPFLPKGDRPVYCADCFARAKPSAGAPGS